MLSLLSKTVDMTQSSLLLAELEMALLDLDLGY